MTRVELLAAIAAGDIRPKLMTAAYASPCALCDWTIEPGDDLAWNSDPKMGAHRACFLVAMTGFNGVFLAAEVSP
jgi:hypothetical protein